MSTLKGNFLYHVSVKKQFLVMNCLQYFSLMNFFEEIDILRVELIRV